MKQDTFIISPEECDRIGQEAIIIYERLKKMISSLNHSLSLCNPNVLLPNNVGEPHSRKLSLIYANLLDWRFTEDTLHTDSLLGAVGVDKQHMMAIRDINDTKDSFKDLIPEKTVYYDFATRYTANRYIATEHLKHPRLNFLAVFRHIPTLDPIIPSDDYGPMTLKTASISSNIRKRNILTTNNEGEEISMLRTTHSHPTLRIVANYYCSTGDHTQKVFKYMSLPLFYHRNPLPLVYLAKHKKSINNQQ